METLPELNYDELRPTRDYLQDVAKVLGRLQQAFLAPSPRDWQYGLEVTMRGIATQTFELNGQPARALIDLVRHKIRFGDRAWPLRQTPPAQLFSDIQSMLDVKLGEPEFSDGILEYDQEQADNYSAALWWLERRFASLKDDIHEGVTSPILLYPHHFDLSLVWFPHDDERQLAIGFSTGDETVAEPYIYRTAYPETTEFKNQNLLYSELRTDPRPDQLLADFATIYFKK